MKQIIEAARAFALQEIKTYELPPKEYFLLSEKKWLELADVYQGDKDIVHLGVICMDIQLGVAVQQWVLSSHVQMGIQTTKAFLASYDLDPKEEEKILECVEKHHGADVYTCIEAEICANADCYRFLHPKWFFLWLASLGKRNLSLEEIFVQAEYKLDEKYHALSLDRCKQELVPYYEQFKKYLQDARSV